MSQIHHEDWDINTHVTGRFYVDPKTKRKVPIMGAIFQNGLNDKNLDGTFSPCDEGVSHVVNGVTHLQMNRGRMGELRFGDSGDANQNLVKLKNKKEINGKKTGISFKYTDSEGEAMEYNGGKPKCTFANGISIESTPYYKGVKMDILIEDPLTAPTEYNFSCKTYGQDYTVIEENGGLTFRGEDQEPIFIKPPYAIDANGDIGTVTIHYLGMENNLHFFKKVVDKAWLRAAIGTVRIDPDVIIIDGVNGTIIDTAMNALAPTFNYGTSNVTRTSPTQAALLAVDLSAFSGYTVVSSKFSINYIIISVAGTIAWHRVLKSWIEGISNGAANNGEPTYNSQSHNVDLWDTVGCAGDGTDRQTTSEGSVYISATGFADLDMTNATSQAWLDNSGNNHGIVIPAASPVNIIGHASEQTNSANRPKFYLEYTEGAGDGLIKLRRRRGRRWM